MGTVYLYYGDDDFSIRDAVTAIIGGVDGDDMPELNTSTLEGSSVSFEELMAACHTLPFMSPRRLVVVKGLLTRFGPSISSRQRPSTRRTGRAAQEVAPDSEPQSASGGKPPWDGLPQYLATLPDSTVLVLEEGELSPRNPLLKGVSSVAKVKHLRRPREQDLAPWVRSRVQMGGGKIAPEAVRLLTESVGNNLWALATEIEKLLMYADGRAIVESDVRNITSQAREANIFAMADAVAERKMAQAAHALHELLADGAAPLYILSMLTRQFRLIIRAKAVQGRKLDQKGLAEALEAPSKFVVDKAVDQARGYDMPRLERIYNKLLDTDLSIKRGRMPPQLAVEVLVAELCLR